MHLVKEKASDIKHKFQGKTIVYQKKTLPLPRFLRDDNIMSNLLIKTNLSINN